MDALNSDPYHIFELGIPSVRHFIYKSKLLVQYSEPGASAPYTDGEEYRRWVGCVNEGTYPSMFNA